MTAKHENLVQAQYAAEAGVKRVVAACNALNDGISIDWNWLKKPQSIDKASYKTTIVDDLTGEEPSWATGITSGIYRITSGGTANGSSKTVVALANITAASNFLKGNFPDVTMYSNGNIDSDREFRANTNGLPVQAKGYIKNVKTSPETDLKPNTPNMLPKMDYDSYKNSDPKPKQFSTTPTSGQTIYLNDSNGKYYYDGDLIMRPSSNVNIEGRDNGSILFVNGDVIIDASNGAINFNKPLMIVAIGNIQIKNTSAVDVVLYAMGGDVTIESTNWNGGAILAGGDIKFKKMQNCNSKSDLLSKFVKLIQQINEKNKSIISCTITRWSDK